MFQEHFSKSQLELELAQPTTNSMGFHNQDANSADKIVKKLYKKISADTTAPATYYEKSEATAATQMNQHMQQLAQETQQNIHMQKVLQNLTSQVANLQNQLTTNGFLRCRECGWGFFCLCHEGVARNLDPDLVYGFAGIVDKVSACIAFLVSAVVVIYP